MLSTNTVTKKYAKNAIFLEYNSNVIPTNAGQTPLSIGLQNLSSLNYCIVNQNGVINDSILNASEDSNNIDTCIYHFQNKTLPKEVQPATSPNIALSYIKLTNYSKCEQSIAHNSSNVFYVISGSGSTTTEYGELCWNEGDIFILPYCKENIIHQSLENNLTSSRNCYLLYANDGPLLRYLGGSCHTKTFEPTIYTKTAILEALQRKAFPKGDKDRDCNDLQPKSNRNGVLLSNPFMINRSFNTLSPTMWSLYNTIPPNCIQKPHRHNSVALDYCVFSNSSTDTGLVYTLMGTELNSDGTIREPHKLEWKKGGVFITPPGWWHSHVNESNSYAYVFPIQDAGLHTYMNTLDIQFVH